MFINNDALTDKLAADLDLKVLRSQIVASNVANVDTPGYIGKDLKFDRILADSMEEGNLRMKRTHVKHITPVETPSGISNEIIESPNPARPDGNNVNIDDEMLKLSEINIQYNVSVQLLSKRLRQIYDAIERTR